MGDNLQLYDGALVSIDISDHQEWIKVDEAFEHVDHICIKSTEGGEIGGNGWLSPTFEERLDDMLRHAEKYRSSYHLGRPDTRLSDDWMADARNEANWFALCCERAGLNSCDPYTLCPALDLERKHVKSAIEAGVDITSWAMAWARVIWLRWRQRTELYTGASSYRTYFDHDRIVKSGLFAGLWIASYFPGKTHEKRRRRSAKLGMPRIGDGTQGDAGSVVSRWQWTSQARPGDWIEGRIDVNHVYNDFNNLKGEGGFV